MKKLLVIIILLICISTLSYSQSITEFGVTTEGAWFVPVQPTKDHDPNRNGFAAGIGVYASSHLFWRVSADIGLMYRYKQMQQHYEFFNDPVPGATDGGGGYGDNTGGTLIQGWEKYPLHYMVVPVHLQLLIGKFHFIRGGIESTWLTNYEVGNNMPEYNWTVGWGSQKHKLKWSVNYIQGFKDVGFKNGLYEIEMGNVKYFSATVYRSTMLQVNLSYPIWQNK